MYGITITRYGETQLTHLSVRGACAPTLSIFNIRLGTFDFKSTLSPYFKFLCNNVVSVGKIILCSVLRLYHHPSTKNGRVSVRSSPSGQLILVRKELSQFCFDQVKQESNIVNPFYANA